MISIVIPARVVSNLHCRNPRPDVDWRTHADVASDTDPIDPTEAAEPLEKAA